VNWSSNAQRPHHTSVIDARNPDRCRFRATARERIRARPCVTIFGAIKRACGPWFDTHSEYYPFEGELFPFSGSDKTSHQQIWLPLFAALVWIYTLLGLAGAWCLWRAPSLARGAGCLLAWVLIFYRLALFLYDGNPEPRYTVGIFPFSLRAVGCLARLSRLRFDDQYVR